MNEFIDYLFSKKIIISLLIIILGIIFYAIIHNLLKRIINKKVANESINKKRQTYLRLFNSILKYIVLIIAVILILQVNGVNVTSIIAGLGVISVIAGLALQDALKDIIMGFNIIVDEYFSVGDVIKIDDIEAKIIELGFKATKMEDIHDGRIITTANRNINQAIKLPNWFDVIIPLPYELPITKAESTINVIIEQLKELKNVKDAEYKSVQEFAESSLNYKIRIYAKAELKGQTKRDVNRIIKLELDKRKISIPYTQIVIHNEK